MSPPTAIGHYSPGEVARLAGVSAVRVGRWAREEIVLPSVSRRPNVYSYADAGEALLAHYLVDQGKPPGEVRSLVHHLRKEHGQWPLATAPLAHDGTLVLVWDSERKRWVSVDRPGHDVIGGTLLNLRVIREALQHGGWASVGNRHELIEVDPDRYSGQPVVRGTRVPTHLVDALAGSPEGIEELHDEYDLNDEEIAAAKGYEAAVRDLIAA